MYKKIADHISESLVSSGSISGSEIKVYSYAAELLLSSITGLIICISIGLVFGELVGSIIFLSIYCPLRQFSGGYHAANHISCATIFCIVFLANTLIAHYLVSDFHIITPMIFVFCGASLIIVIVLSPVEDKNKPITRIESSNFKRKSIMLCGIAMLLIVLLVKLQFVIATYYACSAVSILAILLVIGKIKNVKGEKPKMKFMKSAPLMAALLMTLATASVNSASWWMIYQPEIPEELLKRK